ncbi:MAG: hypothetical protein ACE5LU_24870 [Anaerolineae bacterium]
MRDLSAVRTDWDEIEAEETRLLRELTVDEGIRQLIALHRAFESQLQETEDLFRADRAAYLIKLQQRLSQLAEWRGEYRMENLVQSLVALQERLEEAGILSVVIGGIAVTVWGEPRLTRDVDIKVLLDRDSAQLLLDAIRPDYVPLHPDPIGALELNGFLFVQDSLGTRLDLLLAETGFDMGVVRRAQAVELRPGLVARVCTAEDLIIYKLISLRPRDHADAESVVRRQGDSLDDAYVLDILRQFEQALDDSTLVAEYQRLRAVYGRLTHDG